MSSARAFRPGVSPRRISRSRSLLARHPPHSGSSAPPAVPSAPYTSREVTTCSGDTPAGRSASLTISPYHDCDTIHVSTLFVRTNSSAPPRKSTSRPVRRTKSRRNPRKSPLFTTGISESRSNALYPRKKASKSGESRIAGNLESYSREKSTNKSR